MPYRSIQNLLDNNKAWVAQMKEKDPRFFEDMAENQNPAYLWIGCSDSRVPPNLLTGTEPGEIFIHRNIANMVVNTDYNLHSVLKFAVDELQIKHIIVCGHYNCGGIAAAMSKKSYGFLDNWLLNIKNVILQHKDELKAVFNKDERAKLVTDYNVIEQVKNLAHTATIQEAWKTEDEYPILHGWVYDIHIGELKELIQMNKHSKLDDIFAFD